MSFGGRSWDGRSWWEGGRTAVGRWFAQVWSRFGAGWSCSDGGQTVAVVRGWLSDDASPSPLSRQSVKIQGVLHPDEEFYEGANATRVVTVDSAALADAWGEDVIDGYVILGGDQGDPARGVPMLVPPTVQVGDVAFPLQNFFYAIQWWVFALFAVVIYARWLYLDAKK